MKQLIILAVLLPLTAFAQNPQGSDEIPDMGELFLQQLDENGDGKVTLDEFRKPSDQKFQFMDRNKDGVITAEEARNFARMMMQRMQYMQQQIRQQPNLPR